MLEITEGASEVIERAYAAASRFNPDARVRVYATGGRIETGFADAPEKGDTVIEHEGLELFVQAGIEGVLDVSAEHDHLIVR